MKKKAWSNKIQELRKFKRRLRQQVIQKAGGNKATQHQDKNYERAEQRLHAIEASLKGTELAMGAWTGTLQAFSAASKTLAEELARHAIVVSADVDDEFDLDKDPEVLDNDVAARCIRVLETMIALSEEVLTPVQQVFAQTALRPVMQSLEDIPNIHRLIERRKRKVLDVDHYNAKVDKLVHEEATATHNPSSTQKDNKREAKLFEKRTRLRLAELELGEITTNIMEDIEELRLHRELQLEQELGGLVACQRHLYSRCSELVDDSCIDIPHSACVAVDLSMGTSIARDRYRAGRSEVLLQLVSVPLSRGTKSPNGATPLRRGSSVGTDQSITEPQHAHLMPPSLQSIEESKEDSTMLFGEQTQVGQTLSHKFPDTFVQDATQGLDRARTRQSNISRSSDQSSFADVSEDYEYMIHAANETYDAWDASEVSSTKQFDEADNPLEMPSSATGPRKGKDKGRSKSRSPKSNTKNTAEAVAFNGLNDVMKGVISPSTQLTAQRLKANHDIAAGEGGKSRLRPRWNGKPSRSKATPYSLPAKVKPKSSSPKGRLVVNPNGENQPSPTKASIIASRPLESSDDEDEVLIRPPSPTRSPTPPDPPPRSNGVAPALPHRPTSPNHNVSPPAIQNKKRIVNNVANPDTTSSSSNNVVAHSQPTSPKSMDSNTKKLEQRRSSAVAKYPANALSRRKSVQPEVQRKPSGWGSSISASKDKLSSFAARAKKAATSPTATRRPSTPPTSISGQATSPSSPSKGPARFAINPPTYDDI